ncbi:hypothetical protein CHS0354_013961 [Potamilus streckersoni]|uniref:Uncharacterized protein n=1 Tax=Potamilus streckersoni TaxID=2493646 RepID=A0AAE0VJY5_9BIVA|nr:hypothetical protein CHS0354_013961 [Potamilus streckersoni]
MDTCEEQQQSPDSAHPFMSSLGLKKDKTCLVCGDRALGYNFNAVSCESCKAFFRRNAHKTIRGRCEGRCEVTVESRSFCKRCRLAKCFTVGMQKEMILNDEQKNVRKQKIIINKLRRQGQLPPEDTYAVSEADIRDVHKSHSLRETTLHLKEQFPNLTDAELQVLSKIKMEEKQEPSLKHSKSASEEEKTEKCKTWLESEREADHVIACMDLEDQQVVIELRKAHEQSSFLASTSTQLMNVPQNPTEFFNIAEGFVRRIIKLAKYIESFRHMDKDDQISLLKGSVVEIMMLRSSVNYDPVTESWNLSTRKCLNVGSLLSTSTSKSDSGLAMSPDSTQSTMFQNLSSLGVSLPPEMDFATLREQFLSGQNVQSKFQTTNMQLPSKQMAADLILKINQAKHGEGSISVSSDLLKLSNPETRSLFLTYSKFIKSLMKAIYGDLTLLKFLIVLSLFTPDRQDIKDRDYIEKIQLRYAVVMQKYAELRFPDKKMLFPKMIMKLTDLRNVNEVHTKMLLKMKLDEIEPLLVEIFDLPV